MQGKLGHRLLLVAVFGRNNLLVGGLQRLLTGTRPVQNGRARVDMLNLGEPGEVERESHRLGSFNGAGFATLVILRGAIDACSFVAILIDHLLPCSTKCPNRCSKISINKTMHPLTVPS